MEQDLVKGSVVLFGTPAEETTSDKLNFVKEGVVQDKVDFAMMLVSFYIIYKTERSKFKHFCSILLLKMAYIPICWH
jgi:metal-dependent amidase/aminoacylase/carboxypeptidase family protein